VSLAEIRIDRTQADVAVFELLGEYDMTNARELELGLQEAASESRGIVLDLSETEFLDSSTIHVFFKAHEAMAKGQGKRLALCVQTASVVTRVLEICDVGDAIPITAEREHAIEIATGRGPEEA
jgi:anti-anti-sigma factor